MPHHPSPTLVFETPLWEAGVLRLAGIDEAGRGAWAGPVSAGAVILPAGERIVQRLEGVRDSKQMTAQQRERWAAEIKAAALNWGVGFASFEEIDCLGILPATRLAMQRAVEQLVPAPEHLLIDAVLLDLPLPQTSLIHGDALCLSIAAASVLAKTARDAVLRELDGLYPGYDFARHKGYGTAAHRAALAELGPCPVHRRTYAPVAACLQNSLKERL